MNEEEIYDLLKRRAEKRMMEREATRMSEGMSPGKQIGNILLGIGGGIGDALGAKTSAKDILSTYNREDNARLKALDKDDGLSDLVDLYKVQSAARMKKDMQDAQLEADKTKWTTSAQEAKSAREARAELAQAERDARRALRETELAAETGQIGAKTAAEKELLGMKSAAAMELLREKIAAQKELARMRPQSVPGSRGAAVPKTTATQGAAAGYARRLEQAEADMSDLAKKGYNRADRTESLSKALRPEFLETEDQKLQEQAERNFINAVLRRESGASISPAEFDSAAKQYFPRAGDSSAVLQQKERNRRQVIESLKAEAGAALGKVPQVSRGSSPQDTQALEWARQHPEDPRSAQILQKLGVMP